MSDLLGRVQSIRDRPRAPVGGSRHYSDAVPSIPASQFGVPMPVWGKATNNSNVTAANVGQARWVKVTIWARLGPTISIPLIDESGTPIPFVDPAHPPLFVVRRTDAYDSGDEPEIWWADPQTPDAFWKDKIIKPTSDVAADTMVRAAMRRANSPVPHWVLEVDWGFADKTAATDPFAACNINVDILTNWAGPKSATSHTLGPGTPWKAKIWDLLDVYQTHGGAPSALSFNQGVFGSLAHDHIVGTTTLWLTATGLAGGASVVDVAYRPLVRVLGHEVADTGSGTNLKAGSAENTWRPGSRGLGFNLAGWANPYTISGGQQITYAATGASFEPISHQYQSTLVYDSGAARYKVLLNFGGGVPAAIDRTFYVFVVGRVP